MASRTEAPKQEVCSAEETRAVETKLLGGNQVDNQESSERDAIASRNRRTLAKLCKFRHPKPIEIGIAKFSLVDRACGKNPYFRSYPDT